MRTGKRRINFDVTFDQQEELDRLKDLTGAATAKEAILKAVRIVNVLADETRRGSTLFVGSSGGEQVRVILPDLVPSPGSMWRFVASRPDGWMRQYFVKGRRLRAAVVWRDMRVNGLTVAECAANWDLPIEAIDEIVRYCDSHRELVEMEEQEERRRSIAEGVALEPATLA